jgi:hypothetical protein
MTRTPSRALIYGLIDPRDRCLRYIGKTHKRRELRLAEHVEAAKNGEKSHIYNWIRLLLAENLEPEIFVIRKVKNYTDWEEVERNQIKIWRNSDHIIFPYTHPPQTPKSTPVLILSGKLTNIHDGGAIHE